MALGAVLAPLGAQAGASGAYQATDLAATGHGLGSFNALSCVSSGNCVSVGNDYGNGEPLVSIETSGTWSAPFDVVASSSNSRGYFDGVSCVNATDCVVVGSDNSNHAIVLTGNPDTWSTAVPTIVTASGSNSLGFFNAVSCTDSTHCTAVGYDYSDNPIVLSGNPSTWTSATSGTSVIADPSTPSGFFYGVSCLDPTHCTAVGDDSLGNAILLTGNPAAWTTSTTGISVIASTANSQGNFNAVSCSDTTHCTIVGYDASNNPIVLTGDPTSWTASTTSSKLQANSITSQGFLYGVSCASATDCTAVGTDNSDNPVVFSGDPNSWSSTPGTKVRADPTTPYGYLYAVDCARTAPNCTMVGQDSSNTATIMSGDPMSGLSGVGVATPGHQEGSFNAVSCVSDGNCVGVGSDDGSGGPLVQVETAGTWAPAVALTASSVDAQGSFYGVSCTTLTTCTVVGSDTSNDPVVLTGNPSTWTSTTTAVIVTASPTASHGTLQAVSCPSITTCTAVGFDSSNDPIILTGNPSTWTNATIATSVIADAGNASGYLKGVSCATSSSCTAVGFDTTGHPVSLTGNPSSWTSLTQGTLVLASASSAQGFFYGVSCPSVNNCTVVGEDNASRPIVLTGDPGSWTSATTGSEVTASSLNASGYLIGVSCVSANNCTAVGYDTSSEPIILGGDPNTWTSATTGALVATPSVGTGRLSGVSCAGAGDCLAVGEDTANFGYVPMIATNYVLPLEVTTLNSQGGTLESSFSVNYGASVTLPNPSLANYSFAGWFTAAAGGSQVSSPYIATASLTLYAHWIQNAHRVTFNGNGATKGSMSPQTANATTALAPNAFSRTRDVFTGWNTAASGVGTAFAPGAAYSFLGDLTLYAQWRPVPHASHVAGYAQVGTTRTLTITGSGFTSRTRVRTNQAHVVIRVKRATATRLTLSVKVLAGWTGYKPLPTKTKRFRFTITTPTRSNTTITYLSK